MAFGSHAILDANMSSQLRTFYVINNKSIGNQYEIANAWLLGTTQYWMHICKVNLAHSTKLIIIHWKPIGSLECIAFCNHVILYANMQSQLGTF